MSIFPAEICFHQAYFLPPFVDFFWKNKHKNLKDAVKAGEKAGGFDMLDFLDGNDNFKKITG